MSGAVKAIGSIFSPPKVKPPKEAPKIPIADPDSARAEQAALKKLRERATRGREGTIYSQSYGGQNLGGTA